MVCAVATAVVVLPAGLAQAMSSERYDGGLLAHTNSARGSRQLHQFRSSKKLAAIAHKWAKHLARTGSLEHDPNLASLVQAGCPHWTAIGENIAAEASGSPKKLFRSYMGDAAHRDNMLGGYTQVGIATVTAKRHGHRTHYNVIDFANHCPS
jgi:uncharacterized protein YkwD